MTLLDAGTPPETVCRRLGCSRMSLWRWQRARDVDALAAQPIPGRPRKLTPRQEATLLTLLAQGALAHGFGTDLWTQPRVRTLVHRQFGVTYHHDSIGRMLHRLGWSVQKPERRAVERDDAAIARWKTQDWPRLKKKSHA